MFHFLSIFDRSNKSSSEFQLWRHYSGIVRLKTMIIFFSKFFIFLPYTVSNSRHFELELDPCWCPIRRRHKAVSPQIKLSVREKTQSNNFAEHFVSSAVHLRCVYTGREATRSEGWQPHEWSLTSLAQNKPTVHQQFCLNEAKQLFAKFATGCNFSQIVDDVKFWLLRVASCCFVSGVNAPLLQHSLHPYFTFEFYLIPVLRNQNE